MPPLADRLAARIAFLHAAGVYRRFLRAAQRAPEVQRRVLLELLARNADSRFGREHDFSRIRTVADFQRAVPLRTYEQFRPYVRRMIEGDAGALLGAGQPLRMFATTSGTTSEPKYIPVTPRFVRDYRRGWNTFGLKALVDHPRAVLRAILQSSSRHDEHFTALGVPCGAITGMLALTQKRIVRRYYIGTPEVARIADARARYYVLMRLALTRDVGFAITANPATLIQLARIADEQSEALIRDVRDGTLAADLPLPDDARRRLSAVLRPDPRRAAELAALRSRHGRLRPRDYWSPAFLACWIGGSMGQHLERLREWYGPVPVRDIGLLASEGRVTIPFVDDQPVGALDVRGGFFEFLPVDVYDRPDAPALTAEQLESGAQYVVVLTNATGLVRYRLDDVVAVRGWLGRAPLLEFLYRAGGVASVTGEKLTERQVVEAVRTAREALGLPEFDYVLSPAWSDPPFYRLNVTFAPPAELAPAVDDALCRENQEYASRRKSLRIGLLRLRTIEPRTFAALEVRGGRSGVERPEQHKRLCLLTRPDEDERLLAAWQGWGGAG